MAENYVKREEFEALKNEVDEIKDSMKDDRKLLQKIDKQTDVILEKLNNVDKTESLKQKSNNEKVDALEKRVTKTEDNQIWLWRLLIRFSHRSDLRNSVLKLSNKYRLDKE